MNYWGMFFFGGICLVCVVGGVVGTVACIVEEARERKKKVVDK